MIDILLAVYNGEKHLAAQLASIFDQNYDEWHIILRDDGSTDKSVEIAEIFSKKHPGKMTIIKAENSGSAKNNFIELLKLAKSEYIMFCDHDDVWLFDKIKLTLGRMKAMEKRLGTQKPLLVHTDLIVADEKLDVISYSFFDYQGLDRTARTLPRLLAQNNVTGCTMMINRALQRLFCKTFPSGAADAVLMHDWWLALLAASCGKIGFVDAPTIMYRQHRTNELGAVKTKNVAYVAKCLRDRKKSAHRVGLTYTQAVALYGALRKSADSATLGIIGRYVLIPSMTKISRTYTILSGGYTKQNIVSIAGQIVFC